MYQIEKFDKKSIVSQVEDALMDYILEQPVHIGEKIPNEFELTELFGVGRSTIREAVKSLVSKKVLEVRRGSGTYVIATSSIEDDPLGISRLEDQYKLAKELLQVRLLLEPEIAAMAAEQASEEEKLEVVRLCDLVEKRYSEGKNHIKQDIQFHSFIARCSQNRVIENIIPLIVSAVSTFANITMFTLKNETIETHRMIANAIAASDPEGARYAMIMHLNYNRMKIQELEKPNTSDV